MVVLKSAYLYPKDGQKSVSQRTRSGNKSVYVVANSRLRFTALTMSVTTCHASSAETNSTMAIDTSLADGTHRSNTFIRSGTCRLQGPKTGVNGSIMVVERVHKLDQLRRSQRLRTRQRASITQRRQMDAMHVARLSLSLTLRVLGMIDPGHRNVSPDSVTAWIEIVVQTLHTLILHTGRRILAHTIHGHKQLHTNRASSSDQCLLRTIHPHTELHLQTDFQTSDPSVNKVTIK